MKLRFVGGLIWFARSKVIDYRKSKRRDLDLWGFAVEPLLLLKCKCRFKSILKLLNNGTWQCPNRSHNLDDGKGGLRPSFAGLIS